MTKKEKFKQTYENFVNEGAKYIGVYIWAYNTPEPELILNPIANSKRKLEYYLKAYDDNMRLKRVGNVKILSVTGAIYLEDLEDNAVAL